MTKIHKKQPLTTSCYELSLERLAYTFEKYDSISVSFSGGKDSTVCLHLSIEAARAAGRLPLTVYSFDEEAIPPETVEYMARVAEWPEIRFLWYCVPIQHRNACSTTSPFWYPWAPEDRAKWVRPLPPLAITDYPGFTRGSIAEQIPALFPASEGLHGDIMGIRTQESMSRYMAIAMKTGHHAYFSPGPAKHIQKVYPIYDWATEDVWLAPSRFGWDYNRAYDVMDGAGLARHDQRCAPPFGEQPIRRLHSYKTCWPELWAKMVDRVPGAATAARYANTELYGIGLDTSDLPDHVGSWREWTLQTLRELSPASRQEAAEAIHACIRNHRNRTGGASLPDVDPHPVSGFSWRIVFLAARVGGNKFDRILHRMTNQAIQNRRKHAART